MLYFPSPMPDLEISTECCAGLDARMRAWTTHFEKTAHEQPVKAAGYAFAAGLIIATFPIGRIAAAIVRLGLTLVRPALLVLGLAKLFDEIDRRRE